MKLNKRKREEIEHWLSSTRQPVFNRKDLRQIYAEKKHDWEISREVSIDEFPEFLEKNTGMFRSDLVSGTYKPITKYTWGKLNPLTLGVNLKPNAFLSHASAVFIHGLNQLIPNTVYVNKEQSKKPKSANEPTQESIDRAFSNKQRVSKYVFTDGQSKYQIISGKHSNNFQVRELPGPDGYPLRVTSIERTLVDITVRPAYAGGVFQVCAAYEGAKEKVSLDTLSDVLTHLDYAYPYHQAIGFYLEKAGYSEEDTSKFRGIKRQHKFYLDYAIPENQREYNERWKMYYPKNI